MRSTLLLAVLTSSVTVSAFLHPTLPQIHPSLVRVNTQKLSEIDEMCLENVAELCLQETEQYSGADSGECDLEDHEALLNQLEAQRTHLAEHLEKIDTLVGKLRGESYVNGQQKDQNPQKPFFAA